MKKFAVFILLTFCSLLGDAQSISGKMASDIKKLSGEWLVDFKNVKGGLRSDNFYESVFYSRQKIAGTVDSSNLIHFLKETETWKFTADLAKASITTNEFDSAMLSMSFSFGKLKKSPVSAKNALTYIPTNKKDLTGKIRSFFIFLQDAGDKNPGYFSLTLGQEDFYMLK